MHVVKAALLLCVLMTLTSCNSSAFSSGGAEPGKAKAKKDHPGRKTTDTDRANGNADEPSDPGTDPDANSAVEEEPKEDAQTIARRKALPKFAMMANDFECGFCHVQVIGTMASTATVPPSRGDSVGEVVGDWMVRGQLQVAQGGARITVSGKTQENYQGKDVPEGFPVIAVSGLGDEMKGKVSGGSGSSPEKFKRVNSGNTVLIGTPGDPIVIDQDVLIEGDLVITGTFKGVGTIYVTGNIFIPYDLKAESSPFPFEAGDELAHAKVALKDDGLGLAAAGSIFVGDVQTGVIGAAAKINSRPVVEAMYSWYGKNAYEGLYGATYDCDNGKLDDDDQGVNVIDAFLYAAKSIEGKVDSGSYSIRGGILTNYYNILNGESSCQSSNRSSPAHGHPMNRSYIEYDHRLQTGEFPVLEHLGEALRVEGE